MKTLIFFLLLISCTQIKAQRTYSQVYHFGKISVKTGYCTNGNSSIKILEKKKELYQNCGGDGAGYIQVDTMNINSDKLIDFIFSYQMEEYVVVGMLISNKFHSYDSFDIINIFPPDTYSPLKIRNKDRLKEYILIDVNKDGKNDILTNVIIRNKKVFRIPNFTDTIKFKYLKDIYSKKLK